MARMQKTINKADETRRSARETVATGVEETRSLAAEVLDSIGAGVRRNTGRAGHATGHAGARIADRLERRADQVRPSHGSFLGYFRRHPMRMLLLLGVMTGVVALIAIPMLGKRNQYETDYQPYAKEPYV